MERDKDEIDQEETPFIIVTERDATKVEGLIKELDNM